MTHPPVPQAERDRLRALAERMIAARAERLQLAGWPDDAAYYEAAQASADAAAAFQEECTPAVVLSLLGALDAGDRQWTVADATSELRRHNTELEDALAAMTRARDLWKAHADELTASIARMRAAHPKPGATRE